MSGHASEIIGYGALTLYTLGVIKSLGQLRASHIDEVQGLPLVPLDRHLQNGLGILLSPVSLAGLLSVLLPLLPLLLTVPLRQSIDREITDAGLEPWQRPNLSTPLILTTFYIFASAMAEVYSLFVSWPISMGYAIYLLVGGVCMALVTSIPREQLTIRYGVIIVGFGLATVMSLGLKVYFASDPLPRARIHMLKGADVTAPLIATSDGVFIVGVKDKSTHQEVPLARVASMTVTKVKAPEKPSVLELIGVQ